MYCDNKFFKHHKINLLERPKYSFSDSFDEYKWSKGVATTTKADKRHCFCDSPAYFNKIPAPNEVPMPTKLIFKCFDLIKAMAAA